MNQNNTSMETERGGQQEGQVSRSFGFMLQLRAQCAGYKERLALIKTKMVGRFG
jgi:hypothetical protein